MLGHMTGPEDLPLDDETDLYPYGFDTDLVREQWENREAWLDFMCGPDPDPDGHYG